MKPTTYVLLILIALPLLAGETSHRKSSYKEKLDSALVDERSKATFSYDEHGNNTSVTYFYFMNNEWTANSKYHYTYDNKNRLTSEWSMSYENGVWVGQTVKTHYGYDSKGRIYRDTVYDWDETARDWKKYRRTEYAFYTFDSLAYEVSFLYDSENSEWKKQYKTDYTYDSRENLTLQMTYAPYINDWRERSKIEYLYDYNGNKLESVEYNDTQNNLEPFWEPMVRYRYGYNAESQNTTYEKTEYRDGTWYERQKAEMTYHSSGKLATTIIHNKQGEEWVAASKRDDNYDEHGNHTCVVIHKYSTDWTPYFRYDYDYDTNTPVTEVFCPNMETYTHKVLSESVSSWDATSNEWTVNSINNFFYSDLITPVLHQKAPITESDVELYLMGNKLKLQTEIIGRAEVSIITLQGREIYTAPLQQNVLLDLSPFAEGVYTGIITSSEGVKTFRFVK